MVDLMHRSLSTGLKERLMTEKNRPVKGKVVDKSNKTGWREGPSQ